MSKSFLFFSSSMEVQVYLWGGGGSLFFLLLLFILFLACESNLTVLFKTEQWPLNNQGIKPHTLLLGNGLPQGAPLSSPQTPASCHFTLLLAQCIRATQVSFSA